MLSRLSVRRCAPTVEKPIAPAPAAAASVADEAPASSCPETPSRPRNAASIAWHVLLRRTYDVDAQVCGRCGDRMRVIAVIQDPAVAARIVDHLARPGVASARGPP